ncbi:zinc knuckle CX2CX4HX4C containing protein [Tanacetum coccineum]
MMSSKGFFFFQFKTLKGLEDALENGPWMIHNSPIILKKWSMNTRLCKEELTHIPVWVKIHDVPIQDHCPKNVSIPPSVDTPVVEKTNDGFQIVGKDKKSKFKSTNGGQFGGHSVKQNIRYEPKATANVQNKGATNVGNASKSGLSQVSTLLKISPLRLMFLLLRKVIYYV